MKFSFTKMQNKIRDRFSKLWSSANSIKANELVIDSFADESCYDLVQQLERLL